MISDKNNKIKLDDGESEMRRHHFRLKDHRLLQGKEDKKETLLSGESSSQWEQQVEMLWGGKEPVMLKEYKENSSWSMITYDGWPGSDHTVTCDLCFEKII